MGDVIHLQPAPNPGNGAREALLKYFGADCYLDYVLIQGTTPTLCRADHLLAWLWSEGLKVVPITEGNAA